MGLALRPYLCTEFFMLRLWLKRGMLPILLFLVTLGGWNLLKRHEEMPRAYARSPSPLARGDISGVHTESERRRSAIRGGRFHKALKTYVDHAGIDQPPLQEIGEVQLTDETPVIGIEVAGQAIAFISEKMMDPRAHIVNLNFNQEQSVSISYCYLADCVRVLHDSSDSPIPLHVGGLDINNQMVFLYDGERYAQNSTALPFDDYPFERLTLGEWKQRHPTTKVCIPPSRVPMTHRQINMQSDRQDANAPLETER